MAANQVDDKGVRVSCSGCGRVNRLPFAKLGNAGKCGHCGVALPIESPADVLDGRAFAAMIRESAVPILVDFWAPWCGPCRTVAPELEKLARANAGRFLVAKVDTQALPSVGTGMRVHSIPTMAVFRSGRELDRSEGARPAHAIEAFVTRALTATAG